MRRRPTSRIRSDYRVFGEEQPDQTSGMCELLVHLLKFRFL